MKHLIYGLASGVMLLLAVACGKSDSGNTAAALPVGTCVAGQGYTAQYGCLPQGQCQVGMVQYGTTCVAATGGLNGYNTGYGTGTGIGSQCGIGLVYTYQGCLPQGQCQVNSGYYNGQCLPGMAVNGVNPYGQTGLPGYATGYPAGYGQTGYGQTGYGGYGQVGYQGGGYQGYPTGYSQGYPNYNPSLYFYVRY